MLLNTDEKSCVKVYIVCQGVLSYAMRSYRTPTRQPKGSLHAPEDPTPTPAVNRRLYIYGLAHGLFLHDTILTVRSSSCSESRELGKTVLDSLHTAVPKWTSATPSSTTFRETPLR